jgi:hypothetical protein
MASLTFLGLAMMLLAPMFGHARYLDLTLPKMWKRLPVFMRGTSMHSRRVALYYVPCLVAFAAVLMLGVAILQDIEGGPRSNREVALTFALVLGIFGLGYPINVLRQLHWVRAGGPKLR